MNAAIKDAPVGWTHEGRARHLTLARGLALSGGPFETPGWPERNLHTDIGAANEAGLGAVVASGTQWGGYVVGMLVDLFGRHWFESGELDVKITRSVKIGETLQPKARLENRTPAEGGERIELEVRCDNEEGLPVLLGRAWCTVPAAGG